MNLFAPLQQHEAAIIRNGIQIVQCWIPPWERIDPEQSVKYRVEGHNEWFLDRESAWKKAEELQL